jgi:hypothetical protein
VGGRARRDPVARALREADRLHAGRADPADRTAALQRYLDLLERNPDDHRVLSRVTRALVFEGMAEPAGARGSWQAAQEYGLRCLMVESGFSAQVTAAGGRVTPAAVARMAPQHAACAAWTAEAWARKAALRDGGGVALGQPAMIALARRGAEDPGSGLGLAQAQATLGLVLALTPDALRRAGEDDERTQARAALQAALEEAPERLLTRVDLAEHVLMPAGEVGAARAMLAGVRDAPRDPERAERPEDAWARARAEALLQRL